MHFDPEHGLDMKTRDSTLFLGGAGADQPGGWSVMAGLHEGQ